MINTGREQVKILSVATNAGFRVRVRDRVRVRVGV